MSYDYLINLKSVLVSSNGLFKNLIKKSTSAFFFQILYRLYLVRQTVETAAAAGGGGGSDDACGLFVFVVVAAAATTRGGCGGAGSRTARVGW
jgi:hypothetical protein